MKYFISWTSYYECECTDVVGTLEEATVVVNQIMKTQEENQSDGFVPPTVIFGKEMVLTEVARVTAYELKDK